MGCTVREKHVRANRKSRGGVDSCCSVDRVCVSKSVVESSLKNLVYHPGPGSLEENVWGYCTQEHLEEILLKHLEFLYNQAVCKIVQVGGYEEPVALRAVLCNGHCYGDSDVLANIVTNSLSYLSTSEDPHLETTGFGFEDLRELHEYSLAGMIYLLQQAKPNLTKGDAMWCLLMSELNVARATTIHVPTRPNQDSNTPIPDLSEFMPPALCRFHGGWDFGNAPGLDFSATGFALDSADLKLQREIVCPTKFKLSPAMKSLLKRNVAAFAAGFRASMKHKQVHSQTTHVACDHPSEESVSLVLDKFRDLNLDDKLEMDDKDGVIVDLLQQLKDLENKLKERKEWAQKKAMQAAQKVSDELAELKSLNSERKAIQLLKKGKQAVEESTVKRLTEMENALRKASSQIDRANAVVRTLENQNAEIRAEREGSKLSASESLKTCMEESKKEKKCLKKLVAWEKQKTKLQDEITAEKEKIKTLSRALAQITQDEKEIEGKWRQEQNAKEQAVAQVEEEQRSKEATEANNKRKLETLRLKIEIDFQRHKDDHQRLEQELSRLQASSETDSSHISNSSWKSQGEDIVKLLEELNKLEGSYESGESNDRECMICMKDEVSVVFLPCAHQVVCSNCSDNFFSGSNDGGSNVTCPCCRGLVEERIRIFGATS